MMTIPCAICGTAADVITHRFYSGTPERPDRRWQYDATLYHRLRDGVPMPLCSAKCAVATMVDY